MAFRGNFKFQLDNYNGNTCMTENRLLIKKKIKKERKKNKNNSNPL